MYHSAHSSVCLMFLCISVCRSIRASIYLYPPIHPDIHPSVNSSVFPISSFSILPSTSLHLSLSSPSLYFSLPRNKQTPMKAKGVEENRRKNGRGEKKRGRGGREEGGSASGNGRRSPPLSPNECSYTAGRKKQTHPRKELNYSEQTDQ